MTKIEHSGNNLVFGWVAENVKSNWANWSNWKSFGTYEDSAEFWKNTVETASLQRLTWFCYENTEVIYHEEDEVSF